METAKFFLKADKRIQTLSPYINEKTECSDRELFVAKLGRKYLTGKYFKLTIDGKVDYVCFPSFIIKKNNKHLYKFCGIRYYPGWNSSTYTLDYMTQNDIVSSVNYHINDLVKMKFEEISKEKFLEVYNLFR